MQQDETQLTAQLYGSMDANPAVRTAAEAALQQASLMPGTQIFVRGPAATGRHRRSEWIVSATPIHSRNLLSPLSPHPGSSNHRGRRRTAARRSHTEDRARMNVTSQATGAR
jgi:hypothetical protein